MGEPEDCAEALARRLFLQGAAREAEGRLHEATSCYRRAVQLVPDIECRLYNVEQTSEPALQKSASSSHETTRQPACDAEVVFEDLPVKFRLAQPVCEPEMETKSAHISHLPPELLVLLLRWVVSSDLDFVALENCSRVCRALYLVARDSEIWRLACARVWGSCLTPRDGWRNHFILQPRVRFNGCYISRTTYIRPGEQSFQDIYRLWHAVEYYRYLRFFPGGQVLMLTSAEEPAVAVGHLRSRCPRNSAVLVGAYRLCGSHVVVQLRPLPQPVAVVTRFPRRRFKPEPVQHDSGEKTFHVELEVVQAKNRKNSQLCWQRYCVETAYKTAPRTLCPFDICPSNFPPLWFSRVKSYTGPSEACL